jgi:hypothetical protein
MTEAPLDVLAAQQRKILDELHDILDELHDMRTEMRGIRKEIVSFRDDMRVITALVLRQDNAIARLLDRVGRLEEQP